MTQLIEFLRRQTKETNLFFGIAVISIIGYIDYITGPEFGLSIFYLIPICGVAWFAGRRAGITVAFWGAVVWLAAELAWHQDYSYAIVPFWNAIVRLGLFIVSGALTAEVSQRKRIEVVLLEQTAILESILKSMADGVLVTGMDGTVLVSNPAAERILKDSFKDKSVYDWLKEQGTLGLVPVVAGTPPLEHPLTAAITGKSIDGVEMVLRDAKTGTETWLSATARPLVDERNATKGGVIVISDVSARKNLEKQIAEISEREQRRIGQDLHDGLCQHLVSTAFAATLLQRKLADQKLHEATEAEQIADMINESISQARGLARGLYPVRLEDDGLAPALEQLAEMTQTLTGINCEFRAEGPVHIHDRVASANLYRIAQEAVNNAVKHAKPARISIDLEGVEEEITLTISDDGPGFTPGKANGRGMGLHIMNYRARLIGASLDVRRGLAKGTTVSCSFLNADAVKEKNA